MKELSELKSRQNDLSSRWVALSLVLRLTCISIRVEDLTSTVRNLQSSFCGQLEQQSRQLICLSVRVDAIETQLGRFLYGNISDRHNSSAPFLEQEESKRPDSSRNGEWLMPFTLKCVGTFQVHMLHYTTIEPFRKDHFKLSRPLLNKLRLLRFPNYVSASYIEYILSQHLFNYETRLSQS